MKAMSEKESAIGMMDDLVCMLADGDEWIQIRRNDPWISAMEAEETKILDALLPMIGKKNYMRLESVIIDYANAVETAAILYGIHVADSIRTISAHSELVSQRIVDRMVNRGESA